MSMTVVVTRNSPGRVRGFLASCMCEIAPGVYSAPRMNAGVRDRIWAVLEDWFDPRGDQGMVMTWPDNELPGGQAVRILGSPRTDLVDHHGVFLARRDLGANDASSLITESAT